MAFLRGGHPITETMATKNAVEICKCETSPECDHLIPLKLDPEKIQEGDTVKHHPTGQVIMLLGVDTKSGKVCHTNVLADLVHFALVSKGKGINQFHFRYRQKTFGAGWDNEHALEEGDPDQEQPEGEAPAPLPVRKPKEAPPMELGEPIGMLECPAPACGKDTVVQSVTNYPGQMFAKCPNCGHEFRPGKYWADKLKPLK